eukprot:jgi/Mesen1/7796/ME000408S06918
MRGSRVVVFHGTCDPNGSRQQQQQLLLPPPLTTATTLKSNSSLAANASSRSLRSFLTIFWPSFVYPMCPSSLYHSSGTSPTVFLDGLCSRRSRSPNQTSNHRLPPSLVNITQLLVVFLLFLLVIIFIVVIVTAPLSFFCFVLYVLLLCIISTCTIVWFPALIGTRLTLYIRTNVVLVIRGRLEVADIVIQRLGDIELSFILFRLLDNLLFPANNFSFSHLV